MVETKIGFASFHSTEGVAARAAAAHVRAAGIEIHSLLRKARLTRRQIDRRDTRISAYGQIRFLALAAEVLDDDLLGFHLALRFDLRAAGLLYYVMASSDRLDHALRRAERYTRISNEALSAKCRIGAHLAIDLAFLGVARRADHHQMELWTALLVRVCRSLTGRQLRPTRVRLVHHRAQSPPEFDKFFGCSVEFGAARDEIEFSADVAMLPIVSADPFLHDIMVATCEELLARRLIKPGALRLRVENAVVPLLPDGNLRLRTIAQRLGMSERTLGRHLASEGTSFGAIVDELRSALARRYLNQSELSVSQIAWLLGYQDLSAFTHAFKRWTGKSPTLFRARITRPAFAAHSI
jgi:AraC-like DNA-binding protein